MVLQWRNLHQQESLLNHPAFNTSKKQYKPSSTNYINPLKTKRRYKFNWSALNIWFLKKTYRHFMEKRSDFTLTHEDIPVLIKALQQIKLLPASKLWSIENCFSKSPVFTHFILCFDYCARSTWQSLGNRNPKYETVDRGKPILIYTTEASQTGPSYIKGKWAM